MAQNINVFIYYRPKGQKQSETASDKHQSHLLLTNNVHSSKNTVTPVVGKSFQHLPSHQSTNRLNSAHFQVGSCKAQQINITHNSIFNGIRRCEHINRKNLWNVQQDTEKLHFIPKNDNMPMNSNRQRRPQCLSWSSSQSNVNLSKCVEKSFR